MTENNRYNLDPELFAEFANEAAESLEDVESLLVELENTPDDLEIVQKIFRPVHSMKGNAAFFNLSATKTLAHDLENLLDKIRKSELIASKPVIDVILKGVDMLRKMIERVKADEEEIADAAVYDAMVASVADVAATESGQQSRSALLAKAVDLIERLKTENELDGSLNAELDIFLAAAHIVTDHNANKNADAAGQPQHSESTSAKPAAAPPESGSQNPEVAAHIKAAKDDHQKTIRVSEQKVDDFLEFVSELVILSEGMNQLSISMASQSIETAMRQRFTEINTTFRDLAEGLEQAILSIRMVPAKTLTRKLPRMVRDLAESLHKKARLEVVGDEIEIDKSLIEALDSPLTHLIRNSLDHGFEEPEMRDAVGKDPVGLLKLEIQTSDENVLFILTDDGRGIDAEAVRQKAISNGLVSENAAMNMDKSDVLQLIFASGLSTAKKVSDVSGRGVGMDVVRTTIEDLGGTITLDSNHGEGTTVTLALPVNITTVVEKVLVVRFGKRLFSIPESSVMEVVSTIESSGKRSPGGEVIKIREEIWRVLRLANVLGVESSIHALSEGALVLVKANEQRVALAVDEVISLQQVIIRQVDGDVLDSRYVSGIGMHGNGDLSPVLNVNDIIIDGNIITRQEAVA